MAPSRVYTVHINPSLAHPYESAEFVREGFNWKAFLFTGLWALYNRLWWKAIALFAYNFFIIFLLTSNTLSHTGLFIIDIGVHLVIGFEANEWVRTKLQRQGYLIADITTGDSPLRAELRFFDRYFSASPAIS